MKAKLYLLVASLLLATTSSALAIVRFVNVNNAHPTPPYTNWATAATNIQDAVDAAVAGDQIVVTNGTYTGGSRVDPHGVTNRVVVDKPMVLSSVNGPEVTRIDGGSSARCVYLTNSAVLVGFALTNGGVTCLWMISYGGGVYCESTNAVLTNCVLAGNSALNGAVGGGAYGGTLNNCTLTGNSAVCGYGGGAYGSMLNNCTLTGNSAAGGWFLGPFGDYDYSPGWGGGACSCTLNNCTLTGNAASDDGGGAVDSTLIRCTVTGNLAYDGGGTYNCTLTNCTLTGNSTPAGSWGGAGAGPAPAR
jgi:hypothetical protein